MTVPFLAPRYHARKWRGRRIVYYLALCVVFCAITFYFGPNWLLFHKLTRLGPEDFVDVVHDRCVLVVSAIQRYESDQGHAPDRGRELVPEYLPERLERDAEHFLTGGRFFLWGKYYNHNVTYRPDGADAGWFVSGAFANGRIPVPLVIVPQTRPSTMTSPP